MLDEALDHVEGVRDRPAWTPVSAEAHAALDAPIPLEEEGASAVCSDIIRHVLPYSTGNTNPRFFGWVHGTETPAGIIAEMMAAAMNSNVGGRNHGAVYVERQVIEWCRELFGFPLGTSGLVVSGTSMATIIALAVARHRATEGEVGTEGLIGAGAPLVGYTSQEAHNSVSKAFELLGLGKRHLRAVPVNEKYEMDTDALAEMVRTDRNKGLKPFCVIATAGTVNTAAIDDLTTVADICAQQDLWLHVDGALAIMHDALKDRLAGIERADSLAFDFHKWMHVPYDAGCVLIRDGERHRQTFSSQAAYLQSSNAGLAGGEPWFCEFGPELSRGFRSLKVWTTFKTYGLRRLGQAVWQNCRQAKHLAALVESHGKLELMAPVSLAIVCFRYADPSMTPEELDAINRAIVSEL